MTSYEKVDAWLAHFGVKGMRWGQRKENSVSLGRIPLKSETVMTTKLKNGGELQIVRRGYEDQGSFTKFLIRNFKSSRESLESYHEFTLKDKSGSRVGKAAFTESDDRKTLYLEWLGVDKDHRRQGYAKASMQGVIKYAQNQGIEKLEMTATDMGAPLYASLGFKPVGKVKDLKENVSDRMSIAGEYEMVLGKKSIKHELTDVKSLSDYIVDEINNSEELNSNASVVKKTDGNVKHADSAITCFLNSFGVNDFSKGR